MQEKSTIVTACDRKYFWGAYLLVASLKYNNVKSRIKVLGFDLSPAEVELLEQFDSVQVSINSGNARKGVHTQKPEAIFLANTDYITWMDSDCLAYGDITKFLTPKSKKLLIRFRGKEENSSVFLGHYSKDDVWGKIPKKILNIWKQDLGANKKKSAISSNCLTNCFTFYKSDLSFIRKWKKQMRKVLSPSNQDVYNKSNFAYFMTDESVFNSLLAFSDETPDLGDYPYDKQNNKHVAHFGIHPKPWEGWTKNSIKYYRYIQRIFDWVSENNYQLPPIPFYLQKKHKILSVLDSYINFCSYHLKYKTKMFIARIWFDKISSFRNSNSSKDQ